MRTFCVALVTSMTAAIVLTACGGGGDSTSSTAGSAGGGGGRTLNGSMPITKQLSITFPVPKSESTDPPGTAAAIAAGRKACKGKTPLEVREEFISAASDLTEPQEEIIAELPKFEKQKGDSPNFAAGQLGAGVYEATLPEKQKRGGFRGCVYELSVQLRSELEKKIKRKKSKQGNEGAEQ